METPKIFEGISLPAEEGLFGEIKKDVESGELVGIENITVIGTDKKLLLANGLRGIFPEAGLTVVDRNKKVKNWAEKSLKEEDRIRVEVGEVGGEGLMNVEKANLVIVKHLIHFAKNGEERISLLKHLGDMVETGGRLIISVPSFVENRVVEDINNFGWVNTRVEVGSGMGKSIVWKLTRE